MAHPARGLAVRQERIHPTAVAGRYRIQHVPTATEAPFAGVFGGFEVHIGHIRVPGRRIRTLRQLR